MNTKQLIDLWKQEERQPFVGWDFSYLNGRMLEEQYPWNYADHAVELMGRCSSMVDMGTGGGELLLKLRESWPEKVTAAEEYPPNLDLATRRLTSFGVRVVYARLTKSDSMPFADNEFGLVLNRHSAFNSNEVARILAPGGTFLTEQVHGLWASDLLACFNAKPQWPEGAPGKDVPMLKAAGLTILDAREWSGRLSFTDVGAIVYYLKAVPWLVPGFAVDTHLRYLLLLQQKLDGGQPLTFTAREYLIEARKGRS